MEDTQSFEVTQGNVNGIKLTWLIVNGGTKALEICLKNILSQKDLLPNKKLTVGYLRNQGIRLESHQMDQFESGEWDVSLLVKLLRGLFCDELPPGRWNMNDLPDPSDHSVASDIIRINYYRNRLAHRRSMYMSENEFKADWKVCSEAIIRLGVSREEIDTFHKMELTHKTKDTKEKNRMALKGTV